MPILLKEKRHLLTRFLPWSLFCLFIAVLPFIIGIGGSYLSEMITGEPCGNEGECGWLAFIWLIMFSFPLAALFFTILSVISIIDIVMYFSKK